MKKNDNILISVCITSYNRPVTLVQTIESVRHQTYKNLEIIIIDDLSTDPKVENVLSSYQDIDPRVKYIIPDKKLGLVDNFNVVKRMCKGKYLLYLNDDDWLDENYIEESLSFLEANPNYILATGKTKFYVNEKFTYFGDVIDFYIKSPFTRVITFYDQMLGSGNCPNFGLIRLEKIQNLFMSNLIGHDCIFVSNLAYLGNINTLDSIFIHRRLGGTSTTLTISATIHNFS